MPWRLSILRSGHLFAVLLRHTLSHLLRQGAARWPWLAKRLPGASLSGPERLRAAIEELGGTFIKLGQMLALQPDILPLSYCNELLNLMDRVSPFGIEQVEKVFIEEFGRSMMEIFDKFEPEPIATASIGQVHVAYLDGRKLAVKVQRPNVRMDFAGDIRLLAGAITLIKRLRLKMLYWMVEPISEFMSWTQDELDYRHEAHYMQQHRSYALKNPREYVPEVIWDYTSRRTLAMEFVEGLSVMGYLRALEAGDEITLRRLNDLGFDPNQFVHNILLNFLGDAYRFGLFHADLHPANLMILPNNAVGYVDFGITGVLSRWSRQSLVALTLNLGRGDLDGMCGTFFSISATDANSDVDGFRDGIKKLADQWYETPGNERRLVTNTTVVMFDMLALSRKTGIYPERDVVKYIRSAIAIDGLITRLAPAFELGQHLETICSHYLKWEARRALFSYNTLFECATSSSHLLRDGALRAASVLKKAAAGELAAHAILGRDHTEMRDARQHKAVLLGGVVFVISVLITTLRQSAHLGANLFTVEAAVITAAIVMLVQTIHRLVREQ
ncbi:MAG TPA: AarF/UbiB family protein [Blastocatellia bacterium]|nr:AarF/UbiB family protein [Blastocatellia bacterium]